MSLYDYQRSRQLAVESFYSLVMAAMRRADSSNLSRLQRVFPEVWQELETRYNSPGGLTEAEAVMTTNQVDYSGLT